jgi:hypothetical protein
MFFDVDDGVTGAAAERPFVGGPSSAWMANARFGLRPAPGGLALVQDFLNTGARAQRCPDLLADICGEVLAGRERRIWQRLKQCANPLCRVVFDDRSWNNSGALHAWACSEHCVQTENDCGAMG